MVSAIRGASESASFSLRFLATPTISFDVSMCVAQQSIGIPAF